MARKNQSLADYLKAKRESSGLNQADVSKHFGYATPQFVSNWERGVSMPPVETLKTLAKMYRVNAEEIFNVFLEESLRVLTVDMKNQFGNPKFKGYQNSRAILKQNNSANVSVSTKIKRETFLKLQQLAKKKGVPVGAMIAGILEKSV